MRVSSASVLTVSGRAARSEGWRGLTASISVMLGFVPFAFVLGANASRKGLGTVEVPLMTGLNFGGGSEFAVIDLWTSPPKVMLLVAVTLLFNSRHILMGATLAPFLKHLPRKRALPALFLMCDESWAMGLADARRRREAGETPTFSLPYYLGLSVGLYLTWIVFTAVGAVIGPMVGNIDTYGFDMAFVAVFLVLLRGMWRGVRPALPWLVSLIVAAAVSLLVPGAWYVAAGALAGVVSAIALTENR